MADRVIAVTGMGAVSGFGWGVEPLWRGLRAGQAAVRDFDRFDHARHRTHVASQVPAAARNGAASWCDLFALEAAAEAVASAGLSPDLGKPLTGVFFSSTPLKYIWALSPMSSCNL